jgi:hypothetical protein
MPECMGSVTNGLDYTKPTGVDRFVFFGVYRGELFFRLTSDRTMLSSPFGPQRLR